jgi:hypothetical protein
VDPGRRHRQRSGRRQYAEGRVPKELSEHDERRRPEIAAGVFSFLFVSVAAIILVRAIPFVHMESAAYLYNAIDGRPALAHVFDVQRNDFGLYQARELSYAVDWPDAAAVAAVFKVSGLFLAISWWHVLAIALIVALGVRTLREQAPQLGDMGAMLPFVLLVSSPSVLLATRHFRTAKALAALALFGLAVSLIRKRSPTLVFALALLSMLADRQGTFFVVVLALLIAPNREARPAMLALVCAVATGMAYNLLVGPALIRTFGEQEVNWALQSGSIPLDQMFDADAWRGGATWLLDSFGLLAGSLGVAWGAVVALIGVTFAWRLGGRGWGLCAAAALAALFALGVLLKLNHPPIDAPDVRIGYYNLPLHALLTAGLALVLARASRLPDWPVIRGRVLLAGAVLVLLNLVAVPKLATRVEWGHDAPDIAVSVALTRCIEQPNDATQQALAAEAAKVGWSGRYTRLCARYRELR